MRTCTVYGDMLSDKSSENYPTETFCDECFEEMAPDTEDSRIVSYDDYDASLGESCSSCGKTDKEEAQEQL